MDNTNPSLADLPKIPAEIASAVIGKVELKKVSTLEKNILPTKEDVTKERQHAAILSGIENFSANQLKHSPLEEKIALPSSEDIIQEKQHIELNQKIESFSVEQLRHAETDEKIVLPTKEGVW
ncbi:thymosin beta-4 family protein [Dictyocaulus viviparus]|uniref:Thymosin beta-4 family protein n=1 Tax=Dictyocaulus viviparus TaxID=29172 RepID=A0A0D8XKY5_DICVI|nr:thymosin beta-4 family protein [Dictyocaulus viviparus]